MIEITSDESLLNRNLQTFGPPMGGITDTSLISEWAPFIRVSSSGPCHNQKMCDVIYG